MVDDQICVGIPGNPYVPGTSITVAPPSTPTTPAPVPTDIAEGTNRYCGRFYETVTGDYCNLILLRFGISLGDFIFLNPIINANCTNLVLGESYCVQAVGDSKANPHSCDGGSRWW